MSRCVRLWIGAIVAMVLVGGCASDGDENLTPEEAARQDAIIASMLAENTTTIHYAPVAVYGDSLVANWSHGKQSLSQTLQRPVTFNGFGGQTSSYVVAHYDRSDVTSWPIFWMGRNNFNASGGPEQIVADLQQLMEATPQASHAIIIAIPPWLGEEAGTDARADGLDYTNSLIAAAFPDQYLDLPAMIRTPEALASVGINPTAADLANIAAGVTPESFRIDDGHWNEAAYRAANKLMLEVCKSRGWF